ncbi:FAD-dependent monooxygenase [Streptosporangiaceae bacterium NEAU-GS5]|nr:FAD-dependent monooxygenase [Streptosporangiaceae bacterium NEAU-GS5]
MHVMIIGAGTGGMALAHGLRRAGVDVTVFERDRTRTDGLYGYRVGINPTGSRALNELLPPELFETFVATCAREPRYFNVLTEKLRMTASFRLREAADDVNAERSVSRMTLRQVLLTGMDDVVRFDKTFTHYSHADDGRVTAHFADGTFETGDVLVAADGTNSRVRRQYLPHAGVKETGVWAIAAKVPITEETKALLPREVFEGISLLFAPKGQFGVWHVMEFQRDRGGVEGDLIRRWPGLLYDNTADYINWSFSTSADRFPADVADMDGKQLKDLVLAMTSNYHPAYRRLFELGDQGSCFLVKIRTSEPIDPWPTTNITLLGDAVHTMTPGQGVGANTALRDARLLCRELTSGKPLLEAIAAYEAEMIPYGFARVADSLAQNGTNGRDPMYRPLIGRTVLAFSRLFFWTTSRVAPLRHKFVNSLYDYRSDESQPR